MIPVDAYPFTHMASKDYFDLKNMQVVIDYPSSHLGFAFEFFFVLHVVLFFPDLSFIFKRLTEAH